MPQVWEGSSMGSCEVIEVNAERTVFDIGPGVNAGRWELTPVLLAPTSQADDAAEPAAHPSGWLARRIDPRDWPKEIQVESPEELDQILGCGVIPFPAVVAD